MFQLKPDDRPEPFVAPAVPLRVVADWHSEGVTLTELARGLRDDLQVHRDRLTRRGTDPIRTMDRAQSESVELFEAGALVLDTVEKLMQALRADGRFSVAYSDLGVR